MKKYTYPPGSRLLALAPTIFLVVGLLICIDWLSIQLGSPLNHLLGNGFSYNKEYYLLGGLGFTFLGLYFLAQFSEIAVEKGGIRVSIFFLIWKFIPWDEVLTLPVSPLEKINNPRQISYIRVKKLTVFHRLAGLVWLIGISPIITINNQLDGYEELIKTIKDKIELRNA